MRWPRRLAALGLMAGVFFLVGGCFFLRAPVPESPAVVLGPVVGGVGQTVEIPVDVAGFPEPGVGGLAVFAFRYDPAVLRVDEIVGQNGFLVVCSCVNNEEGLAKFIAVHPGAGLTTGTVALLRGVRLALGDPRCTLEPGDLQLVDAVNVRLEGYVVRVSGAPLYASRRP